MKIENAKMVRGEITVPPDKSITHRMIFFASISSGKCEIENPLIADDTMKTIDLVKSTGVNVSFEGNRLNVEMKNVREPFSPIFCGNSGTTTRIGLGFLSRLPIFSVLYGDESLSKRPMDRVTEPLSKLGAIFDGRNYASNLPISVRGGKIGHADYISKVSSAQVKTAFIVAALNGDGISTYREPFESRDHTENFLKPLNAIEKTGNTIKIKPSKIPPFKSTVVGDFSSAAFFVTLGVCHPNARIKIKGVGLNKTRTGFLSVLKNMGAQIDISNVIQDFEPYGDLTVESSALEGIEISPEEIPMLIDEIPLIGLAGAFAKGETIVRGASELRTKESDRINAVVSMLSSMGVNIEEYPDGFKIEGGQKLKPCTIDPSGDHRIAMMAAIAGVCANGVEIKNSEIVSISYPSFFEDLKRVIS
jgi:3-phosphoshikimate 1-carboxyvinyltransferase